MATHWDDTSKRAAGATQHDTAPEPEKLSTLDEVRQRVGKSVSNLYSMLEAIRAPLPTQTGDGSSLPKPPNTSTLYDMKTILRDLSTLGINKIEDLVEVADKMKNH